MLPDVLRPLLLSVLLLSSADACNIPVFRYALERWHPDSAELLVFRQQPMEPTDAATLLCPTLKDDGLSVNAKLLEVSPQKPGAHVDAWQAIAKTNPELPYLAMRTSIKDRQVTTWQGTVASAQNTGLLDSPIRRQLRQRLIQGDSIVWLLLQSADQTQTAAARKLLETECRRMSQTMQLPEGVGLPGSELYADTPLLLRFSVLEISPDDPQETYLRDLLTGFHAEAYRAGEPLLAPVFGRGRVLEVIPGKSLDAPMVEELTTFLCGACSCKVKGLNPGFDLVMAADWDVDLFGEDGERPRDDASSDEIPLPTLITIPPGRKR